MLAVSMGYDQFTSMDREKERVGAEDGEDGHDLHGCTILLVFHLLI